MKGIISWDGLHVTEKKYILSRNGIRCNLCRSIGRFGLLIRAYTARNCLNDLTFLYLLKRAIGIPHNRAKRQTIEAGVAWALLKARDHLLDSDGSPITRGLLSSIIKHNLQKQNVIFRKVVHIIEQNDDFRSNEEWLASISSPFKEAFEYGSPSSCAKTMGLIGQDIGKLIAIKDAINDKEKDRKNGNFNPLNKFFEKATYYELRQIFEEIVNNLSEYSENHELRGVYGDIVRKVLISTSNMVTYSLIPQTNPCYAPKRLTLQFPSQQNYDPCTCLCGCLGMVLCLSIIWEIYSWSKKEEEKQRQERRQRELERKVEYLERQLRARGPAPSGARLYERKIKCERCGSLNPSDCSYCGKCGAKLDKEETQIY